MTTSPSNINSASNSEPNQRPAQRMGRNYVFQDPEMDLFFMAALGWGASGGLAVGQAFYVASTIKDGDADSWVNSFAAYADRQLAQADAWRSRGWMRAAGEARLKAFASYRSAWQFAMPGESFFSLVEKHKSAFVAAMGELDLPATFFNTPYAGHQLPGVFIRHPAANAPLVLVIGGADTCFEDLYLTVGRNLFERGCSVALVDLPGQGITQSEGLHWEIQAEKPIAAVIDQLIVQFGAQAGRIALLGLSLGGYFVARAAGYEQRLATVIASTPFSSPAKMFSLSVQAALNSGPAAASTAGVRGRQITLWKAGATTPQQFLERTAGMVADPSLVHVPFLSIVGEGDSDVFATQAKEWHRDIPSTNKNFVMLDASSGADGHCQVNNRLRLAQEVCGWLSGIFEGSGITA